MQQEIHLFPTQTLFPRKHFIRMCVCECLHVCVCFEVRSSCLELNQWVKYFLECVSVCVWYLGVLGSQESKRGRKCGSAEEEEQDVDLWAAWGWRGQLGPQISRSASDVFSNRGRQEEMQIKEKRESNVWCCGCIQRTWESDMRENTDSRRRQKQRLGWDEVRHAEAWWLTTTGHSDPLTDFPDWKLLVMNTRALQVHCRSCYVNMLKDRKPIWCRWVLINCSLQRLRQTFPRGQDPCCGDSSGILFNLILSAVYICGFRCVSLLIFNH